MSEKWFYVVDGKRTGPVTKKEIQSKVSNGQISNKDFVWCKGMDNWKPVEQVEEFKTAVKEEKTAQPITRISSLEPNKKCIYVKTGLDRQKQTQEFGPYSLEMLKKLYAAKRINGKTLVYFSGLDIWKILAFFEDFEEVFEEIPPIIEEGDKRSWERKPFVARLFFTSDDKFYEGICKDISLGGMQILIDSFPGNVGDEISMNVHPENENFQFVAKAKIVRILDQDNGISMKFTILSDQAKKAISNYIESR
jgi:hypothetical protein